jgi:hypothetical protein
MGFNERVASLLDSKAGRQLGLGQTATFAQRPEVQRQLRRGLQ